jgi:hypothetical protein
MKTETTLLPQEVNHFFAQVSNQKQDEVKETLTQIFSGTDHWEKQVDEIVVTDLSHMEQMELAETARKNAKQARLNAEKLFDMKREQVQNVKAEYDLEDKLWLKAKQIMQIKFKAIEEKAEYKATFAKRFRELEKQKRTQLRYEQICKYSDVNKIEYENMSDESFEVFLSGLKISYQQKMEAEKKAEEERIEKEKAEAQERENMRLEVIRLKQEAEIAQAKIKEEQEKAKAKELELKKAEEIRLMHEATIAQAKIDQEKLASQIDVKEPTIVKVDGQKSELEITKEKLIQAKLALETALAFIIHDNLRKLIESTLKDINSK